MAVANFNVLSYEFRYEPVIEALKRAAVERKVTLKIIVDAKENQTSAKKTFPREENLQQIEHADLKIGTQVLLREARKNNIQHNKFMVLLRGPSEAPSAVWTGSTNLSIGGIHGQTNVGHWIRNADVAAKFKSYWELLADDPGAQIGDTATEARHKNNQLRQAVAAIDAAASEWRDFPTGITPVFSPRSGLKILEMYADLLDEAENLACITLAFGVNKLFKERLVDNIHRNVLTFFLLEREDKPDKDNPATFISLSAQNNTYMAFGSYLREPLHQWAKETSAKILGLNQHVSFITQNFC